MVYTSNISQIIQIFVLMKFHILEGFILHNMSYTQILTTYTHTYDQDLALPFQNLTCLSEPTDTRLPSVKSVTQITHPVCLVSV